MTDTNPETARDQDPGGDFLAANESRLAAARKALDEGTIEIEPDGDRPTPEQAAAANRAQALGWHSAHTPPLFVPARAIHPTVLEWARRYVTDRLGHRHSLLLLGGVGAGKTHQAFGALHAIADSGHPPVTWYATTATELYALMRPGGSEDSEGEFCRLAKADLLLLDDLGASKDSGFVEDVTLRLIDYRYVNKLPMIITSNVKQHDLRSKIGDRTSSRFAEICVAVEMTDEDHRRAR
jgi:DNA replication protein DnaC